MKIRYFVAKIGNPCTEYHFSVTDTELKDFLSQVLTIFNKDQSTQPLLTVSEDKVPSQLLKLSSIYGRFDHRQCLEITNQHYKCLIVIHYNDENVSSCIKNINNEFQINSKGSFPSGTHDKNPNTYFRNVNLLPVGDSVHSHPRIMDKSDTFTYINESNDLLKSNNYLS